MKVSRRNIPLLFLLNVTVAAGVIAAFTVLQPYTLGSDYGICRIISWILVLILLAFAGVMDYSLLFAKEATITSVDSAEKCRDALEDYIGKAKSKKILPWRGQLEKALRILQNFQKNESTLEKLSYAKFGDESEAEEYRTVVKDLEGSVVDAMQRILTRLCIMDEAQFSQARASGDAETIRQYQGHEAYINKQLAFADNLVHSFAELITELSMMGNAGEDNAAGKLQDIIAAIRQLNSGEDEIDRLAEKYK